MKMNQTTSFNFPNHGLTHEANLNLIGLALSSRKIEHDIPISVNVEPEQFVAQLGPESTTLCAESLRDLWTFADSIGLENKRVTAAVHVLGKVYKITFLCYGD